MLNVKDYGAVGDGSTNDTTSIQNTINAASVNETIFFPYGTYYLASEVTVNKSLFFVANNSTILGNGSRLINIQTSGLTVSFNGFIFNNVLIALRYFEYIKFMNSKFINAVYNAITDYGDGDTVEFIDCFVDNLGTCITDTESANSNVINQGKLYYSVGGTFGITQNLKATRVTGQNGKGFGGCGFYLQKVNHIEIDDCRFENCRHSPIYFYSAVSMDGYVRNSYGNNNPGLVYSGTVNTANVEIVNNTITNSISNAIEGKYKRIQGNYIEVTGLQQGVLWGCESEGMAIWSTKKVIDNIIISSKAAAIECMEDAISDLIIENNTLLNCGEEGILLSGTNSTDAFNNILIANNTVKGTGVVNSSNKRSFTLYGSNTTKLYDAIKFKNNNFEAPVEPGLFKGISFDKNILINKSSKFVSSTVGSSTVQDWTVSNGTALILANGNQKIVQITSDSSGYGCTLYQMVYGDFNIARLTIIIEYMSDGGVDFRLERFDANNNYLPGSTQEALLPASSSSYNKVSIGIPACTGGKIKFSVRNHNVSNGALSKISEFSIFADIE